MTEAEAIPLTHPRDGLPDLTTGDTALVEVAELLSKGSGPIAVDTERASGYRYSQRSYLLQFRREGSGSFLVDPTTITDFQPLAQALAQPEWILHSSQQDLGCLVADGLIPNHLFDTELAAKLLGKPKVGLSTLVETELGFSLAKEHSAADWSTRPLPEDWLNYAALDVELLIELRATLIEQLEAAGRREWAQQEFEMLVRWRPNPPAPDAWRRTSGIHKVKKPGELAIVRELWLMRDALAREIDKAPGRILPEAAICEIAKLERADAGTIRRMPTLRNRSHKALAEKWAEVVAHARALPTSEYPGPSEKSEAPPPPKSWPDRFPEAASRWEKLRPAANNLADEISVPAEVLISPELVRRLCWNPETALDSDEQLREWLDKAGARPWQVELLTPVWIEAIASN